MTSYTGSSFLGFADVCFATSILFVLLMCACPLRGQQKPQWMPGQVGLNAGVVPAPGFTYANISINYRSGAFNGSKGSAIPVTGNHNVWAVENLFYGGRGA